FSGEIYEDFGGVFSRFIGKNYQKHTKKIHLYRTALDISLNHFLAFVSVLLMEIQKYRKEGSFNEYIELVRRWMEYTIFATHGKYSRYKCIWHAIHTKQAHHMDAFAKYTNVTIGYSDFQEDNGG
ncbi:hypothetical protein ACJX0J_027675, partial [Zea mays]